jgi:GNAT superfamily N-acetyltransferase
MNETIVTLNHSHIPGAMRLKEAAGWNQTERDWERLLDLEPEGCFGLIADGTLAATTTAYCYGRRLAWIGMVLTDPAFRGRGYARRLMEHAIDWLDRRGVEWTRLDATDMGRPLYLKLGFEDEGPIERWAVATAHRATATEHRAAQTEHRAARVSKRTAPFTVEEWLALDSESFGADRARLLESLASEEAAAIPGLGFAMGRPGSKAAFFGPCACRSTEAARTLLQWFLGRHPGETVFWDLLPANREALNLALEFSFERRRELVRMVRRGPAATRTLGQNDAFTFAIAGFEYG